jgi:hypothetical protein
VSTSEREAPVLFTLELATVLNLVGESVPINQARTERLATVYGISDARVAVLPNLVLATGGRGRGTRITLGRWDPLFLRLDRTAAIAVLGEAAGRGRVDAVEGHVLLRPRRPLTAFW